MRCRLRAARPRVDERHGALRDCGSRPANRLNRARPRAYRQECGDELHPVRYALNQLAPAERAATASEQPRCDVEQSTVPSRACCAWGARQSARPSETATRFDVGSALGAALARRTLTANGSSDDGCTRRGAGASTR